MAFDPTLPANGSPIVSAELRNQLAGLKDLIDAQQATIADQGVTIGDMLNTLTTLQNDFNNYVASHP